MALCSQRTMRRLGAAVVLSSASTAASRTQQWRMSRDASTGRLLIARSASSVTWHQLRLSDVSAARLLTARSPSFLTSRQ
jgi:hypothetical protein